MNSDIPPLPPLPPHMDPDEVLAAVRVAVDAVVSDLPTDWTDDYWLGRWHPEALAQHAQLMPQVVLVAFPPAGVEVDLGPGITVMGELGAQRAREGVARDHVIRLALQTAGESTRLYCDALVGMLEPDVLEVVRDRLLRLNDIYVSEYLVAYTDERANMAGRSESLSSQVLSTAQAGIALGDPDGTIALANDAFCRFFGREGNPIGRPWLDVIPAVDAEEFFAAAADGTASRDVEVRDQMGHDHVVRVSLHGQNGRIQAAALDVSAESEFTNLRRELVGGLVHDLRSPLAVISGWAHTLDERGDRLDAPMRQEALDTIKRSARQLTHMAENLLQLEMLEAGRYLFEPELIDVAARLRSICRPRSTDVEAPVELGLHTDAGAFERMVTNLLDNASTYGVPPVRARAATEADHVRIDVSDAGSVDPAVLESAGRGRVPQARGFGLGLRTTILMARAQGGDLEITSAKPTTFTLRLADGKVPAGR